MGLPSHARRVLQLTFPQCPSNLDALHPSISADPEFSILQSETYPYIQRSWYQFPESPSLPPKKATFSPWLPSPTQVQGVQKIILGNLVTKKLQNKAVSMSFREQGVRCSGISGIFSISAPTSPGGRGMAGHTHLLSARHFQGLLLGEGGAAK